MKMIVMTRLRGLAALASGLLVLAGCAQTQPASEATQGQVDVVTAFYPLQFVSERVAGPFASITTLTQPGAEPHDLELAPQQVAGLTTADLVVYQKGFQPAVDEAVAQSKASEVLDTATVVPLVDTGVAHSDEHSDDDHAAAEGADLDPHVWLDPNHVVTVAETVAERLSAVDPDHAEAYARNRDALVADLESLDREFSTGLTGCQRTEFVTTHAAFGYLAERYGLTQIPIRGLSPDVEPSPARIAEVQAEAREHQVTTIFSETLVSPAVAEAIAGDLGLRTDVLDPVEGLTADSVGQDYLSVMRTNLIALKTANGCP